jgi:Ca2+-binding EF-hand superfamily protein
MKTILAACLVILLAAGFAGANDTAFQTADTNKDGKIGKEEFSAQVEKKFAAYDVNKDGVVVIHEMGDPKDEAVATEFRIMDLNGDGKVTLKEFYDSAYKRFEALDKDRSGSLDRKEFLYPQLRFFF